MIYVKVAPRREGEAYADFSLFVPAGDELFTEYRFIYMAYPTDPALDYAGGTNNPANCSFYRIREAHLGRLFGEDFQSVCRVLQSGEIGFAFREDGSGDFVGGFHGDEQVMALALSGDGGEIALDLPSFGAYREVRFSETSRIDRCNTPTEPLCLHTQVYTVTGDTVALSQRVEWIGNAGLLTSVFMPMVTVQRQDPRFPERRITDTLTFFDDAGNAVATLDTTPYGAEPTEGLSSHPLRGTSAVRVMATGRESGVCIEGGIAHRPGSPLAGNTRISVWPRYGHDLDSKVYFDIAAGKSPKKGEVWEADVFYRIRMTNWQDAYRGLDVRGGRLLFLLDDHEDMIEIRYPDGMVIDVGYIEHWRSYCITVLAGDTKEDWQNPIEELLVDSKDELAAHIRAMIDKHRPA